MFGDRQAAESGAMTDQTLFQTKFSPEHIKSKIV